MIQISHEKWSAQAVSSVLYHYTISRLISDSKSNEISKIYNVSKSPKQHRSFEEFYEDQMAHVKTKNNHLQSKPIYTRILTVIDEIAKKEIIIEQMRKQRDRITYLSDGSKKILSSSKERRASSKDRFSHKQNISKEDVEDLNSNPKNVHQRLFNESGVLSHNRSMMQFRENIRIKKMVIYGSRSRSTSKNRSPKSMNN